MRILLKRLATLGFLGGCAYLGGATPGLWNSDAPTLAWAQPPEGRRPLADDLSKLSNRFEFVARKVGPTVVAVDATKAATSGGRSKTVEESGSGVLVTAAEVRGVLVITNNHVVSGAPPTQIAVRMADDRVVRPVEVLADPESDIAVLRLDGLKDVPTATLGDSDKMHVGEWVLAIGSPFGLNQTITHGIISARGRGEVSLGSTIRIKDFLQTDAAINPGSSGGPLVNLEGEVIGINTAIASQSGQNSGVAFSIPINQVTRVVRQLLDRGQVSRGYLGMQLASSFEASDALRLGLDRLQGALVDVVYPDTPAASAGLKANDIVLDVDDQLIRNESHMITLITRMTPGQKVRLRVWRNRETLTLNAVVGDWAKGRARFDATR